MASSYVPFWYDSFFVLLKKQEEVFKDQTVMSCPESCFAILLVMFFTTNVNQKMTMQYTLRLEIGACFESRFAMILKGF